MINISEGLNVIALTLNENTTNTGYSYIFQFTNTGNDIIFSGGDVETCSSRYNQFNWNINSGTTNLTGGTINIEYGLYDYFVYEKEGEVTINDLNTQTLETLDKVEEGKMKFEGETIERKYYTNRLEKKTYNN